MTRFSALVLAVLALAFLGAGKKNPPLTVRFHSEINRMEEQQFGMTVQLQNPPRPAYISKIPDISERDIEAIYPFTAPDGTMGCAFKLDRHGTLALDTMTIDKRGKSLVVVVNARQVIDMIIDRRVSDGIVTIQRGLAPAEIAMLQKKFPTLGQTGKAKR